MGFHVIALRRKITLSFPHQICLGIKGQVKRHPLHEKCSIHENDQLSFLRGGPFNPFLFVSKECIILEKKDSKFAREDKIQFLQNYLFFCEKPIAYIGNYQNEGVRKQILNVEGSFHSYIGIPEVMN